MNSSQQLKTEVRSTYEAWWSRTRSAIDRHISCGEKNLFRLMNKSYEETVGQSPPGPRVSKLYGRDVSVPYLHANRIVRDWIADTVIEAATNVAAIIEVGSGWGYNLFNIWLRGGPLVKYHAFELTDAGRRCCEKIRSASKIRPRYQLASLRLSQSRLFSSASTLPVRVGLFVPQHRTNYSAE